MLGRSPAGSGKQPHSLVDLLCHRTALPFGFIGHHHGISMIGTLQRVSLREVWPHEAYDLTQWLQKNLDVISDAIDLPLASAEREQSAGPFSVDLVAEDLAGNAVIIENQLEKSDHDHLGKVLTYLVAVGAKTAIWIVADPRPEHVSAMAWLNESSTASFYLLKLEAIKINDSLPAPLFTLIVGPSEEMKEAARTKQELAGRYAIRHQFWTDLLECANGKTSLHANISPGQHGWVGTSAGERGLGYNYVIRQNDAAVELYIDRGKDSEEENKRIFSVLAGNKERIESAFGGPLEWEQLDGRRACRIRKTIGAGGYRDEDDWHEIHSQMIDAMIRLEEALKPHLDALQL